MSTNHQGPATHPAIAVDGSNNIYVAWSQHSYPGQGPTWDYSKIYVKKWNGSSWSPVGAGIYSGGTSDSLQAFRPSIAVLNGTPYVAWYEGDNNIRIHVAHWNGTNAWVHDNGPGTDGAMNPDYLSGGNMRAQANGPSLAVINNKLYAAWVNYDPAVNGVVVKHIDTVGGAWSAQDGQVISANDPRIFGVGTQPHILYANHVYALSGGVWTEFASTISTQAYIFGWNVTVLGSTIYVTWSDRTLTGNLQVHLAHWSGSAWITHGPILNVDSSADASYPSITNDGTNVWVSWEEGSQAQKPNIYTRSWNGSTWSAVEGPHNVIAGSASRSAMVMATQPQVVWDEKNSTSNITRQIYIRGRGDTGASNNDNLTAYGSDGAPAYIGANQWVQVGATAGGITNSAGVGDEAFTSFRYDPITKRAYIWGKYHAYLGNGGGEDQNALLAYSFIHNRWDIVEVGEAMHSEQINGHGHDSGHMAIDTIRGLELLFAGQNSGYCSYLYDLRAGRGKRLVPSSPNAYNCDSPIYSDSSTAYDPDDDIFMTAGHSNGPVTAYYRRTTNTWTKMSDTAGTSGDIWITYDTKNHVFIGFTGGTDNKIYIWDPANPGQQWQQRSPQGSTFGSDWWGNPSIAFDTINGVALIISGCNSHARIYNVATNYLIALPDIPTTFSVSCGTLQAPNNSYNSLAFDSDSGVFLVHSGGDLGRTLAFRYAPSGLATGQWTAFLAPYTLRATKHIKATYYNQKLYLEAGDHNPSTSQATYSLNMTTKIVFPGNENAGFVEEYPECGPGGGQMQPKYPDFIGFPWDSSRNVFWAVSGEWPAPVSPARCPPWETDPYNVDDINPTGQSYLTGGHLMTFDPVTKLWANPINKGALEGGLNSQTSSWDSVYIPDDNIQGHEKDVIVERFSVVYNKFVHWNLTTGAGTLYDGGAEYPSTGSLPFNSTDRLIYFLDPVWRRLYSYNVDSHSITLLNSNVPYLENWNTCPGGYYCTYDGHYIGNEPQMVFDPTRRLLFLALNSFATQMAGFWVYHIEGNLAGQWETLPFIGIDGKYVPGNNTLVYDPSIDAVVAFGGQGFNDGYHEQMGYNNIYVYRYSPSVGGLDTIPPVVAVLTPTINPTYLTTNSTISVTGSASDNVGIDHVTWSNNRSGNGNAIGQTSWSVNNIALQVGVNILTFISYDTSNNASRGSMCSSGENSPGCLTVTYTPVSLNIDILSGQVDLNGNARTN